MNQPINNVQIKADFRWSDIDTVLLDMDGTLLDKYFDDYFWEEYVPLTYARKYNCSVEQATGELMGRYRSVESTLSWTDLDYWSEQLGLDIPSMKCQVDHLIDVHPFVIEFLAFLNHQGKDVYLITAAHNKTLDIKMKKAALTPYFRRMICAEDIGMAKETGEFWEGLEELLGYQRSRTLFADDTINVLRAAHKHGISQVIHVARPSSRIPVTYSSEFPSIVFFNELMA